MIFPRCDGLPESGMNSRLALPRGSRTFPGGLSPSPGMSFDHPALHAPAANSSLRLPWGRGFREKLGNLLEILWRTLTSAGPGREDRCLAAPVPRVNPPGTRFAVFRPLVNEAPAPSRRPADRTGVRSTHSPSTRRPAGHQPNSSTIDGNPIPRPRPSPPPRQSLRRPQPQPPRQTSETRD